MQNHLGASFWPSQGLEGWQLCAWLQAPKSRRRSQEKLVQQLDVMTSYKWLAKQYFLPRWKEGQKHIFDPSKINTMELERVKLWALSNGFLRPWKVQRSWVNFQTEQGSTQRPGGEAPPTWEASHRLIPRFLVGSYLHKLEPADTVGDKHICLKVISIGGPSYNLGLWALSCLPIPTTSYIESPPQQIQSM